MNVSQRKSIAAGAICVAAVLATAIPSLAQTLTTTRSSVTITQVKPEMLNEWTDLQKNEVNPALKKAGIKQRTVLQNVLGNIYEYTTVTPLETFGAYDGQSPVVRALGAEAAARLTAKLRKCIDGSRTFVSLRVNELSLMPDNPATATASVSTRVRIAPGKNQDYESFIRNDILPLYKKGKAEGKILGYSFSRRSLGANTSERTQTVYLNKYADIDAGSALARIAGQDAVTKIFAKSTGLSTLVEQLVRRRVADLSF